MINMMITLRLQASDHHVDSAFNGQEGYEMALQKNYDAILLDMHMPIMDGHETAIKLRANHYTGLIIAVTASVMTQETKSSLASGCNHFIGKPIDEHFEDTIMRYIIDHQRTAQS
jgi:CheY-like chemotaxis protein